MVSRKKRDAAVVEPPPELPVESPPPEEIVDPVFTDAPVDSAPPVESAEPPGPTPEELAAAAEVEAAAEAARVAEEAERQAIEAEQRAIEEARLVVVKDCARAVEHYLSLVPYADTPDLIEWMGRMKSIDEATVVEAVSYLLGEQRIQSEQVEVVVVPPAEPVEGDLERDPTTEEPPTVTKQVVRLRRAA